AAVTVVRPRPEPETDSGAPSGAGVADAGNGMSPLQQRAAALARATVRRLNRIGAWLVSRWQHSLQFRVAATTLLVSGVVVLIVGIFIVDQVSNGILRAKRDAAVRQATVGLAYAKSVFSPVDVNDRGAMDDARSKLLTTQTAGGRGAGLFSI